MVAYHQGTIALFYGRSSLFPVNRQDIQQIEEGQKLTLRGGGNLHQERAAQDRKNGKSNEKYVMNSQVVDEEKERSFREEAVMKGCGSKG